MKKVMFFYLQLCVLCAWGQTLAFPGTEDFGRLATGGRGETVYHVTNLEVYINSLMPGGFIGSRANANGDGSIPIIAALVTTQYHVGLISTFNC